MSNQEFQVISVQHKFRVLRDIANSGLDLVCETRVQTVLQDQVSRASVRAHVAALEMKLDNLEEFTKKAREELAALEDTCRIEEVNRERQQEIAREVKEGEQDTAKQRGYTEDLS